ncbi:MAG: hypothetical protein ACK53L_08255, partial [Pirellulaceae bacterium]
TSSTAPAAERAHSVTITQATGVDATAIFITQADALAYAHGEAPATERAVTIHSAYVAEGLNTIQSILPELLPAGPQDLETASALAQVAAQCLMLLNQQLPVWNYNSLYTDIFDNSHWVTESVELKNGYGLTVYDGKWGADPFGHLKKVSAPVYELARDLQDLAEQSEGQKNSQLDSKQSPEVIAAQPQALAQEVA